ncbi:MAG: N-methylhydantoinase B [Anaerolineae bacterium]|jgi:N-methylhydantoinase B|nr:MAG: N-methylhydantoinase B [Anaerolineae bacterium]
MNARPDPITTEIIRNAFISIADDMNATLFRSAYSPVIYEGRDCAVALLDENGDVLAQSVGVPLFLGNLEVCVKITAEKFGWDIFKPGDVFYMNDSYLQGTHLNDATIFAPIFWRGKRVGFSASRAHWLDVGGKDPSQTTDSVEIYQEGMRWPPTRIYQNGEPRQDILEVLRANSRFGHLLIGDLNAQVAAMRTGEARFQAILDRFGYETVLAARDEIFRQSEQMERDAVKAIPDGVYTARGFLDDDGLGNGPVPLQIQIEVKDDQIHVDLSGSSPMTRGPINSGFAQTVSACRMAFKMLIHPERPVDGGTFRTLTVKVPEGCLFNAKEPAPCQWYFTPQGLLIDLFIKALAPVLPDQAAAAHYGDSMVIWFDGVDPRKENKRFLALEANPGGWGAFSRGDGQDALINIVNGPFKDMPIEVYENEYPIMIREYGIRPDSGGPGRFRGGCGVYRTYVIESPASLFTWFERSVTPAWGLFGGKDGAGPDVVVNPGCPNELRKLKFNALQLKSGDVVRFYTGGGGGYGQPWKRDPERVRDDVINGYVTRQGAERHYGVVLCDDFSVDEEATRERRQAMQTEAM